MAALPDVVFHYSGTFPDHLKVKKTLPLWPLRFSASLSYCIKEQAFYPKLSAKDAFVGGKISYDAESHTIAYRKRFSLPVPIPFLGKMTSKLVATACWPLSPSPGCGRPRWRPLLSCGLDLGGETLSAEAVAPMPRPPISPTAAGGGGSGSGGSGTPGTTPASPATRPAGPPAAVSFVTRPKVYLKDLVGLQAVTHISVFPPSSLTMEWPGQHGAAASLSAGSPPVVELNVQQLNLCFKL